MARERQIGEGLQWVLRLVSQGHRYADCNDREKVRGQAIRHHDIGISVVEW